MDRGKTKQNNEDDYYNPIDNPLPSGDTTEPIPPTPPPVLDGEQLNDRESNTSDQNPNSDVSDERDSLNDLTDDGAEQDFKFNDKGGKKSKKKSTAAVKYMSIFGLGGLGLVLVVTAFLLLALYRQEHLRNLLWDYRVARFHRLLGRQIGNLSRISIDGIRPMSPEKAIRFEKTTLYQNLRGFSPDKAMRSLADSGMTVDVDRVGVKGFRKSGIVSFSDPATGSRIYLSSVPANAPLGSRALERQAFNSSFLSASDSALDKTHHTKFFKKHTRKALQTQLKVNFGDRFREFKNQRKTATPARAMAVADQKNSLGGRSPPTAKGGVTRAAREAAASEALDGKTRPSATSPVGNRLALASNLSTVVFATTMGCLLIEVGSEIQEALTQRIEGPQRLAAQQIGEAEQIKAGDPDYEVMELRNHQFSRAEDSAAIQRAIGTPESEIPDSVKIDPADLPFVFFGVKSEVILDILNVITTPATLIPSQVRDPFCATMLNPVTQSIIFGIEVAAMISGVKLALKASTMGALEIAKASLKIGGAVSANLFLFGYFLPSILAAINGVSGMLVGDDPQNANQLDLGLVMMSNQQARLGGFTEVSPGQAYQDHQDAMYAVKKQAHDEAGIFASINPSNPYSIVSQFAMTMPTDPVRGLASIFSKSLGNSLSAKPLKNIASTFSGGRALAQGDNELYLYGDQHLGIPVLEDEQIVDLAIELDEDPAILASQVDRYKHCFTDSTVSIYFGGQFGIPSTDRSMCNDATHQKLGIYQMLNCGAPLISDTVTFDNCSIIPGDYGDVVSSGQSSDAVVGDRVVGNDPTITDTSQMACPSSPTVSDRGTTRAQRGDNFYNIRLCAVHGYSINASMASNFDDMLSSMIQAGYMPITTNNAGQYVRDGGNAGNFRTSQRQAEMHASDPSSAAPAGRSNHEMGLAIDISCRNADGTQLFRPWLYARGLDGFQRAINESSCLRWINANSRRFGLLLQCAGSNSDGSEILGRSGGCESWHISPNGK